MAGSVGKVWVSIGASLDASMGSAFGKADSLVQKLGASVRSANKDLGNIAAYTQAKNAVTETGAAYDAASRKVDELRKAMAATEKPTKAQATELKKAEKAAADARTKWEQSRQSLTDMGMALHKAGINTRDLTAEQKRLEAQLEQTNRQMKALAQIKDAKVGDAFKRVGSSATSAARDIGLAVGAIGGTLFALAKTTSDLGDNAAKTARAMGITGEALQELRYVGERGGLSVEQFDASISKLTINLGKGAEGSKDIVEALKRLGLEADFLAQAGPEKALEYIAEGMEKIPDATERARLTVALFGKGALKMTNILEGGRSEIRKLRGEARDLGLVLGGKALDDAEAFNDQFLDFQMALRGVRNTIGAELMPVMGQMFQDFARWVAGNGGKVREWAKSFGEEFKRLAPQMLDAAKGIATFGAGIFVAAEGLAQFLGGWENLAAALVAVRLVPVITSLVALGQSLWAVGSGIASFVSAGGTLSTMLGSLSGAVGAVSSALAATPIGWVIAAVLAMVAVVGVAIHYWEYLKAAVGGAFSGFAEGMQPVLDAMEPLTTMVNDLWQAFTDLFTPVNATVEGLKTATEVGRIFGEVLATSVKIAMAPLIGLGKAIGWVKAQLGGDISSDFDAATPSELLGGSSTVVGGTGGKTEITSKGDYQISVNGAEDPVAVASEVRAAIEKMERERRASERSSMTDQIAY